MKTSKLKIAIIQHGPVYLNLNQSLIKALDLIHKASQKNVSMIFFGESWLSGYPSWLDNCTEAATWGYKPTKEVFLRTYNSSISIQGKEIKQLGDAAKKYKVFIGIGVNEKLESGPGNGTIYNSMLFFDPNGKIVNHHRKLMPTYTEKLVYGLGDGLGLRTINTPYGKMGGLICWEHWMPHARQALHNEGEIIHLALWPTVNDMHQVASRAYAFEGRCFVVSVGQILRRSELPDELTIKANELMESSDYLLSGGSCVIKPDGQFLVEPRFQVEEIIYAEIEPDEAIKEKMTLDTSGHYSRKDIFKFEVVRERNK